MKIILKAKIDKIGNMGEIKETKDGYARNFLIPKGLALKATPANLRILEQQKAKVKLKEVKEQEQALSLSHKLSSHSYTISKKAGEDDKLYGAVTNQDIADCISAEVTVIDKKKIQLPEPIKKLGVYQVAVKLYPEVTANIKVWIVKE